MVIGIDRNSRKCATTLAQAACLLLYMLVASGIRINISSLEFTSLAFTFALKLSAISLVCLFVSF